jgi:hypothetical protein
MITYPTKRPNLVIEFVATKSLGRCYSASTFKVTSRRPLKADDLNGLFQLGFLGVGQEFKFEGPTVAANYKNSTPTGYDDLQAVNEDGSMAINKYTNQPYAPIKDPYYVYTCETRVDSSD